MNTEVARDKTRRLPAVLAVGCGSVLLFAALQALRESERKLSILYPLRTFAARRTLEFHEVPAGAGPNRYILEEDIEIAAGSEREAFQQFKLSPDWVRVDSNLGMGGAHRDRGGFHEELIRYETTTEALTTETYRYYYTRELTPSEVSVIRFNHMGNNPFHKKPLKMNLF